MKVAHGSFLLAAQNIIRSFWHLLLRVASAFSGLNRSHKKTHLHGGDGLRRMSSKKKQWH